MTTHQCSSLLNALFGGNEGLIRFVLNGEIIESNDPAFVFQNHGSLRVTPATENGVHFLFAAQERSKKEEWLDCRLEPTACLWRDGVCLFFWAFENPVLPDNADLPGLMEFFRMEDPDEPVPMPGTDRWELVHVNTEAFYTPAQLVETYLAEEVEEAPHEGPKPQTYRDAVCITPYNDLDYEGRSIWVTIGANQFAKDWKPTLLPVGGLIHQLTKHEIGPKDGLSLVFGDMVKGQRKKKSVKTCTAIALDIDTGYSGEDLDRRIAKLKCLAVRYTTNSSNKTSSDFLKDKVLKMFPDAHEITSDMLKEYARVKERYNDDIADSVEYIEDDQTEQGIVVRVSHIPLPKHRIVFPLLEPFVMKDEARLQQEAMAKWAKVPEATANALGVKFDRACTDPSRLFFLPRHLKGRPYEISVFGGPMFNWRSLNMDDTFAKIAEEATKGQSKSVTEEGRALGRWWVKYAHGFQIMDVIEEFCQEKKKSKATNGYNILCPFDEDHSNAGDDSDQACFAVNAADGSNEFFTVKCQHETCKDKTSNDMLGKMLKDEWFDAAILEDREYNEIDFSEEDAAKAKADEAHHSYEDEIAKLKPDSPEEDVDRVILLVIEAGVKDHRLAKAQESIQKALGLKAITPIRDAFTRLTPKEKKESIRSGHAVENNRCIYRYPIDYNFDEACNYCVAVLTAQNEKDGKPTICHIDGVPVRFSILADGSASFKSLSSKAIWSELSKLISFVRVEDNKAGCRDKVPEDIASYIFEQAGSLLRPAPTIVRTPFFLKNSRLLWNRGYHYDIGGKPDPDEPDYEPGFRNHYLVWPDDLEIPEVPMDPTKEKAQASLDWLQLELFSDFPFVDIDKDGKESRKPGEAHALAANITPLMREIIDAVTPCHFVMKPKGGAGGSLLAGLAPLLIEGRAPKYVRYSSNPEEMFKNLVTAYKAGGSFMFFDDVSHFTSKEIHRVLGNRMFQGRVLGGNEEIVVPNNMNWSADGNNVVIDQQMFRRCYFSRLNPKTSKYRERTFRHGGKRSHSGLTYEKFVEKNRGIAISHILTLIQYWINEGKPSFSGTSLPGFESWSECVGGLLELIGVEGFLEGKDETFATEEIASEVEFARAWLGEFGQKFHATADLFELARSRNLGILSGRSDEEKRENFGKKIRLLRDNTFGIADERKEDKVVDYVITEKDDLKQGSMYALIKAPQK